MFNIRFLPLLLLWFSSSAFSANLLVLGDSLSAAYGIQPSQGWVALLERRLEREYPNVNVINASISGETTQGGITRLPALLERHQPHWIVLELAANDGLRGTPIPLIERNLRTLIELSQSHGAIPLLIGVRLPPNYGPAYTNRFFDLFDTLSKEYQISRVPFLMDKVALDRQLMQPDGLHPNAQAQPYLLENVWPFLKPLLDEYPTE